MRCFALERQPGGLLSSARRGLRYRYCILWMRRQLGAARAYPFDAGCH